MRAIAGPELRLVMDPEPLLRAATVGFDAFFRLEYPRLVALVIAVSGDREAAEDVAQEALFRAHQRWRRVSAYDRPGAWVRRVALNLALNARARRRSEVTASERMRDRRALAPADPDTEGFWALVRTLPPRQAAAVALYYLEDLPVSEVATILGCAEGTAKAHLHKGRTALARLLEADARPEDPS